MRKLRVQAWKATGVGAEIILQKSTTKSTTKPRAELHAKLSKQKLGSSQEKQN